jgi:hypothetical protein
MIIKFGRGKWKQFLWKMPPFLNVYVSNFDGQTRGKGRSITFVHFSTEKREIQSSGSSESNSTGAQCHGVRPERDSPGHPCMAERPCSACPSYFASPPSLISPQFPPLLPPRLSLQHIPRPFPSVRIASKTLIAVLLPSTVSPHFACESRPWWTRWNDRSSFPKSGPWPYPSHLSLSLSLSLSLYLILSKFSFP